MTDDEAPRIRITDKRRFLRAAEPGEEPGSVPAPVDETPTEGVVDAETDAGGRETLAEEEAGLEGDLEQARGEAQEYLEHLRRLQAEFDNYRKRVLREQTQSIERAAEPVMRRLLEVLDDFELALLHADEAHDFERFLKGVEMVYAKLVDALRAEGLERIEAEGRPFDPELHEALMQTGEGDAEPVVADVLRPGYTLKGRVLRPSGVRVTRE